MKRKVMLLQIENDRALCPETDEEFFDALQRSLLLDLKERSLLTEIQLRYAEEKLQRQRCDEDH